MSELSPAAQAILTAQAKQRCLNEWDHVNDPPCHPSDDDWNGCYQCIDRRGLAAALRAAADEVCLRWAELKHPADVLNTIADELETK